MAFDAGAVVGRIELEYKGAIGALKAVEQQTKASMASASVAVTKFKQSMSDAALGFAVVGGGITAFMYKAVKGALEEESALFRLQASIAATGKAIDAAKLVRLAEDLMKVTPFTHEATQGMMGLLAAMGFTEDAIIKLTPRVQNLSMIFGRDLEGMARMVGRTILTGTVGGLQRMGIVLDPVAVKTKNLDLILQELDKHSGGAAEAIGKSVPASITILRNAIGELTEDIGKQLLPRIKELTADAKALTERTREWAAVHPFLAKAVVSATTEVGLFAAAAGGLALLIPRLSAVFSGPAGWALAIATVTAALYEGVKAVDAYVNKLKEKPPGAGASLFEQMMGRLAAQKQPPGFVSEHGEIPQDIVEAGKRLQGMGAGLPMTPAIAAAERFMTPKAWQVFTQSADQLTPKLLKLRDAVIAAADAFYARYTPAAMNAMNATALAFQKVAVTEEGMKKVAITVQEIQKAYVKIEDSAVVFERSKSQEVKALDELIAKHRKYLEAAGPEGLALLAKAVGRRVELNKQIADDTTQSAEKAKAAREKALKGEIDLFELWAARMQLAGKALAPKEMGEGYARILNRNLSILKQFPDIYKQIIDNEIKFGKEAQDAEEKAQPLFEATQWARIPFWVRAAVETTDKWHDSLAKAEPEIRKQQKAVMQTVDALNAYAAAGVDVNAVLRQMDWDPEINGAMDMKLALDAMLASMPLIGKALQKMYQTMGEGKKAITEFDRAWVTAMDRIQDGFAKTIADLLEKGGTLTSWWQGICDMFRQAWAEMIGSLVTMFLRDFLNREALKFLGKALFPTAPVPGMAWGGIVTRPTLALVGEGGPEAIVPLGSGKQALAGAGAGSTNINIYAIDTQSGIDFLLRNRKAVADAVMTARGEYSPQSRGRR